MASSTWAASAGVSPLIRRSSASLRTRPPDGVRAATGCGERREGGSESLHARLGRHLQRGRPRGGGGHRLGQPAHLAPPLGGHGRGASGGDRLGRDRHAAQAAGAALRERPDQRRPRAGSAAGSGRRSGCGPIRGSRRRRGAGRARRWSTRTACVRVTATAPSRRAQPPAPMAARRPNQPGPPADHTALAGAVCATTAPSRPVRRAGASMVRSAARAAGTDVVVTWRPRRRRSSARAGRRCGSARRGWRARAPPRPRGPASAP